MIRRTDKIRLVVKNGREEKRHEVVLTITGKSDLNALADSIDKNGKPQVAALVRRAKRFSLKVTPEQANAMKL